MIEDRNVIEQDVETFTDEIPDDALENEGGRRGAASTLTMPFRPGCDCW
jgi:hypothetical protein